MSVGLNGTNQFLDIATPKAAFPYSMSIWFKTTDVTQGSSNSILISNDNGTSGHQNQCHLQGHVANNPITASSYATGWATAYQVSPYPTNNTWHHACVIFNSITDRRVLLDGASKGTNTNSQNTTTINYLSIGCRFRNSPSVHFTGSLAEVAFYDIALSDAEVAQLAGGTSPNSVQSGNLLAYWKLLSDNSEDGGGTALTENNSPAYSSGDHPPVIAGLVQREPTFSGQGSLIVTPTITQQGEPTFSGQGSLIVTPDISSIFNLGNLLDEPLQLIVPGWDSGANNGTNIPWAPALPTIMPTPLGEGAFTQSEPTAADENELTGAGIVNGHETPWFEVAHLLPRVVQELGNVISDQTVTCELYNADRADPITVASITNNLGSGIEVTGVPPAPFNIASQDGLVFDVTVKRTGDLTIDGDYTLTLLTGEEYTLYFTGSRIVLFPVRPEAPLREHLLFDTRIIEAVDASEQRIANRQYPRGMFEATYKTGQKKVELLLFDRQSKVVAYPAWHEPSYLDGAHAVDDVTVTVNTTNYANFYVGGYAVILQDENHYDALKIESMTSTTLTFESGLSYNYANNVQVMPLLTTYIEASSASLKYAYNQQYFNLRIHVDPEINDIADDSAWSVYDSKPFMDGPNLIQGGQLAESLRTKVFVIDNLTGLRTPVTGWDHNKRYSKKGWKTNSRQELWELRQLLHFLKGKQVSFYIPTFWKDIVVTDTMQIGTFALNMDNIGYTVNAHQRWPKQFIRVIFKDGSILVREIQNSAEVSETQEQLTLDDSWPATYEPEDIERIEYLEKIRLDTDDIVMIHYNALGQSECIVPTKEVDN